MQIPIYLNSALREALKRANISPEEYGPAYNSESACLDLYNASPRTRLIPSGASTPKRLKELIPTGIHLVLPPGTVGIIKERSSITKTPLIVRAGVIDPGYTGEVFVNIVSLSNGSWRIGAYQKLPVQLLITTAFTNYQPIDNWEEYAHLTRHSQRQDGKVGSSN